MAQDRITINHLRRQVDNLNKLTGNPPKPYSDGKAQIGNYHIDQAYGGYALEQTVNSGGGVTQLFSSGHIPARRLYELIRAYVDGLEARHTEGVIS